MKKLLFILLTLITVNVSAQIVLDTVNNGTGPGSGNGEILYTAFQKVNASINAINNNVSIDSIAVNYYIGSLTDGAPTAAEINVIIGTAAFRGAGITARIKDNDGTGLIYYLVSDGTNWYWISTTQAL